ncbi:MAG: ComEA family DNA-binding protein [Chloroflexi bacterium]|nr:ComEA family DNA-binding protein [Chloroflexota bacterium]
MATGQADRPDHPRMTVRLLSQVLTAAAILAAVAGAIVFMIGRSPSSGIEVSLQPAASRSPVALQAYVTGAVNDPGVYTLEDGDRLGQLVEAAGGATSDADLEAINLAALLRDEDHWHIPRIGEVPKVTTAGAANPLGKIDVNSATSVQLEELPGIGEVKARSIIQYRESNGPFASVDELLAVRGIGPATLDAIRDLVDTR